MAPDETDDAGKPWPFPTAQHHPPPEPAKPLQEEPTEDALDNGIEESFPASDPVSVTVTRVPTGGAATPTEAPEPEPAEDTTQAQSGTPAGRR